MVAREWLVETENPHSVRVNHWHAWSGRVNIYLDDELIYERISKIFWDWGLEYRFKVDGLPYLIRIYPMVFYFQYELWVDGKLQ